MKYDLANPDWFGTNRLPANGQLVTLDKDFVWTTFSSETVTETFYGTDDNVNQVSGSIQLTYSNS